MKTQHTIIPGLVGQKLRVGLTGAFARLEEQEDGLEIIFYNNFSRMRKHVTTVPVHIGDLVEVGPDYVNILRRKNEN